MALIKGCIFDLDGVIVDTAHYHFLAWKRLADGLGYHLTEAENEQLKGVSRMQSLDIILKLANISLSPGHKQILADKKNSWFNEYIERMTPDEIFTGIKGLMHNLRSQNLKIALASSSRNARAVVRVLEIEKEFDAIVDGNMIRHTKPHPEIFLMAADMLALQPKNCVVIEDAEAGVEAAISAGMKCIGIGSPALLGRANLVLSRASDIQLSTLRELETVNK